MSDTFQTDKSHLLAPLGTKVLLLSRNKMSAWEQDDPAGETYPVEIRNAQANSVRIVWPTVKRNAGSASNPGLLHTFVTKTRKHDLILMIDLHASIGEWWKLGGLVDYSVRSEIVATIQGRGTYLLMNIGNEVGDYKITKVEFLEGYQVGRPPVAPPPTAPNPATHRLRLRPNPAPPLSRREAA